MNTTPTSKAMLGHTSATITTSAYIPQGNHIMNNQIQCPHCEAFNVIPSDDYSDECGSCGKDFTEPADNTGDILESETGLIIATPQHYWELSDEQAHRLMTGLATMLQHRFTTRGNAA